MPRSKAPLFLPFALIALAGCASPLPPPASRLSPAERSALHAYHYPGRNPYATTPEHRRALSGDPAAIHTFFLQAIDPDLDGGESEIYSRNVRYLLFALGDDRFAKALSPHSAKVQSAIAHSLHDLWHRPDLRFPKTEDLLRGFYRAEKGN